MSSPAQVRANRENAKRSTGPRSEAGKENCKYNALTHGLTVRQFVIAPHEDPAEYEALQAQLRQDHQPATQIEEMLVEEIAQSWWRLQRARAQESEILRNAGPLNGQVYINWLGPVLRYSATAERAMHRAITQLRTTQNDRRRQEATLAAGTQTAPAPQPTQTEKVMAIGSVAQNTAEPPPNPDPDASESPLRSVPAISSVPPTRNSHIIDLCTPR